MRGGERRPFNLAYAAAGGVAILVAAYIFVKMSGLRLLE
jgi:hypothetical protein